jgi:hypothetical protein
MLDIEKGEPAQVPRRVNTGKEVDDVLVPDCHIRTPALSGILFVVNGTREISIGKPQLHAITLWVIIDEEPAISLGLTLPSSPGG